MTDLSFESKQRGLSPEIAHECLIKYRSLRRAGKLPRRTHTLVTNYAEKRFPIRNGWDYASLAQDYEGEGF